MSGFQPACERWVGAKKTWGPNLLLFSALPTRARLTQPSHRPIHHPPSFSVPPARTARRPPSACAAAALRVLCSPQPARAGRPASGARRRMSRWSCCHHRAALGAGAIGGAGERRASTFASRPPRGRWRDAARRAGRRARTLHAIAGGRTRGDRRGGGGGGPPLAHSVGPGARRPPPIGIAPTLHAALHAPPLRCDPRFVMFYPMTSIYLRHAVADNYTQGPETLGRRLARGASPPCIPRPPLHISPPASTIARSLAHAHAHGRPALEKGEASMMSNKA